MWEHLEGFCMSRSAPKVTLGALLAQFPCIAVAVPVKGFQIPGQRVVRYPTSVYSGVHVCLLSVVLCSWVTASVVWLCSSCVGYMQLGYAVGGWLVLVSGD